MAVKTDLELTQAGFTESGSTRYKRTISDYSEDLFAKAAALGDRDKATDMPREITHEHVRDAASTLAYKNNLHQDGVYIFCQIGEYVCAVSAGIGGGKIDKPWGILLFGASLTIGVILFVIRNFRSASK